MPKVKASAVLSRLEYIRKHHGSEGLARLFDKLPTEDRSLLVGHLDAQRWVPFDLFIRINVEADRIWGKGDYTLCEVMGRFGAEANLSTLYRLFYRLGSPLFILSKAARLWELHYDSGRMIAIHEGASVARLKIIGFETPHRAHCKSVLGWAARSVEMTGVTLLSSREDRCRLQGDAACEIVLSWK